MSSVDAPRFEEARAPRHVAIIMDGNRRWARARALPRVLGHREGIKAVRNVVRAASELGIEYLTIYGFSSENWKRPPDEIADLMGLLRRYLREDLAELHSQNVRVRVIGSRDGVDRDIVEMIGEAEALTANNTGLTFVVAFNYGGRDEIAAAVRGIARDAAEGKLDPEAVTNDFITQRLHTAGIPDPDLIIRTSGETRLSNFLIWQGAYAEFVVVDAFWPDFDKEQLAKAIAEFHRRERRFGAG